jgi:hypothetical protein
LRSFSLVRSGKEHRGVDLISDALPFGRLWYGEPISPIPRWCLVPLVASPSKVKTMLLFRSYNSVAIPWGRKRVSNIKAAAICLSFTCAAGLFASPTTIIVTNTNDNGAGSLRQALVDANDGDTIDAKVSPA